MKITHILTFITIIFLATTCEHKELRFAHAHTIEMQVIFNWEYTPEAHPVSTRLYPSSETGKEPLVHEFRNHMEREITVSVERYRVPCMNNNTEFTLFRSTDHYESVKAHLANGVSSRPVPRAGDTGEQRVKFAPDELRSDRMEEVEVVASAREQTLTLYPKTIVCRYTVGIENIEGLKYLTEGELFGSFTDTSDGFMLGTNLPIEELATLPFDMISDSKSTVNADLYIFGCPATSISTQHLTVYTVPNDRKKYSFTCDATKEVHSSPGPVNVHTLLDGLPLPKLIDSGGGFNPDVDEWSTVEADISM